jgi:hypothetical protein
LTKIDVNGFYAESTKIFPLGAVVQIQQGEIIKSNDY